MTRREKIENFTPNMLKIYDQCKRRYYYEYIKHLHWPDQSADFELGLSIHKLLDYQAKGFATEMFMNHAREDIRKIWQEIKDHETLKEPVIESEWNFNIRLEDSKYWVEGRIDRLIQLKNSIKYVILDFKTGQRLPELDHRDWQSMIYLYAVSVAKNIEPDNLSFWYFKTDKTFETNRLNYSKLLHSSFESQILKKINEIVINTNWQADKNCKQKYCQYKKLCTREVHFND
jgi:CRISPR/Cas system-associated exonuclease Cas4 (RecB family)